MAGKVVENIRAGLGEKLRNVEVRSPRRVYIDIAPDDLVQTVRYLFSDLGARYVIASGMQVADGFEVLHHFAFDSDHIVVSVRVKVELENPQLESITPLIKGAGFIEREMYDLLGIKFRGHPNPRRLILSDDWPEGVYPLRRGKPWEGKVRKEV